MVVCWTLLLTLILVINLQEFDHEELDSTDEMGAKLSSFEASLEELTNQVHNDLDMSNALADRMESIELSLEETKSVLQTLCGHLNVE